MAWQPPKGMDEYLRPTELCDCDNGELQRKAKEVIKDAETPKEAALKIFSFVRDGIPWNADLPDTKASATLKKRRGDCVNKTNLQVALLRAVRIPARYHQSKIRREWLKDVVSSFLYNRIPDTIWYSPHCECYLSERWVACDSLLDRPLHEAMLKAGLVTEKQIPTIDWDGEKSLVVLTPWIRESVGTFPSLDDVFSEAERQMELPKIPALLFRGLVMSCSNRHTDKLRKR